MTQFFDQTVVDKIAFDEIAFDETVFDETVFDETVFDETVFDETRFDEMTLFGQKPKFDLFPPDFEINFAQKLLKPKFCN